MWRQGNDFVIILNVIRTDVGETAVQDSCKKQKIIGPLEDEMETAVTVPTFTRSAIDS